MRGGKDEEIDKVKRKNHYLLDTRDGGDRFRRMLQASGHLEIFKQKNELDKNDLKNLLNQKQKPKRENDKIFDPKN